MWLTTPLPSCTQSVPLHPSPHVHRAALLCHVQLLHMFQRASTIVQALIEVTHTSKAFSVSFMLLDLATHTNVNHALCHVDLAADWRG